jgi:hypothetical protein
MMQPGVRNARSGLVAMLLHPSASERAFDARRGRQVSWADWGWIEGGRFLLRGPPSASIVRYGRF